MPIGSAGAPVFVAGLGGPTPMVHLYAPPAILPRPDRDVPAGFVSGLYALGGVARGGATRGGDIPPNVFVSIDGVQRATARAVDAQRVLQDSLTVTDQLNETPDTCRFLVRGFTPVAGQELVITLGSINNLTRLFGGLILRTEQSYVGTPANQTIAVSGIDYTWLLNQRTITARFTNQSVTEIAKQVMLMAPGFTAKQVAANLPVLDEITFTNEPLGRAIGRLAKRIHAFWRIDYHKDLYLGLTQTSDTNPTPLTAAHATLSAVLVNRDLDQIVTRVLVEGGGVNVLSAINVGETLLPVEDSAWYDAGGGIVVCGPQRITYTGVVTGRTGSLVGPGAAPTAGPSVASTTGAGLETGTHDYAVTFVTAAGESLVGPRTTYSTLIAAPVAAPVAGTPTAGAGPEDGAHDYAVTFVTANGETTPGPRVTVVTGLLAAPATAPTANTPTVGTGLDVGTHDYAVTFLNSSGETTPSPISNQATISAAGISDPSVAPGPGNLDSGSVTVGDHQYAYTFVTALGETLPSPRDAFFMGPTSNHLFNYLIPAGPTGTIARRVYRTAANTGSGTLKFVGTVSGNSPADGFDDNLPDGSLGANAPTANTTAFARVPLIAIPLGAPTVISRKLYRRFNGTGTFKLVTTLADNATTTYSDAIANAALGAAAPTTNTATARVVPLSTIPLGPVGTTQRKIYGTVAGGTALLFVATLADNTTTTYSVTTADASLGAAAPTTNTANVTAASLTNIPIGGSTVTQRKIYRTPVSSSTGALLKLLATLPDNTTTIYSDTTADASLGAAAPTSDTSGLAQPIGLVLVGANTMPVAGPSAFASTGGWAVIGNGQQVIRYAGISGNSLTGIPTIGAGAITAAINHNTMITLAPMLIGIPSGVGAAGSIRQPIRQGDPVNIFVQVNDEAAQAVLAAYLAVVLGAASDGIQEAYLQDRRLSKTECVARGRALLELQKSVAVGLQYTCRDINTASGKTITVNLPDATNVVGSFTIQHVDISGFSPALHPTFTVTAAPTHVTFDDLMRLVQDS